MWSTIYIEQTRWTEYPDGDIHWLWEEMIVKKHAQGSLIRIHVATQLATSWSGRFRKQVFTPCLPVASLLCLIPFVICQVFVWLCYSRPVLELCAALCSHLGRFVLESTTSRCRRGGDCDCSGLAFCDDRQKVIVLLTPLDYPSFKTS